MMGTVRKRGTGRVKGRVFKIARVWHRMIEGERERDGLGEVMFFISLVFSSRRDFS